MRLGRLVTLLLVASCTSSHVPDDADVGDTRPADAPDAPICATEVCNRIDDDCDGAIDEGCPPMACGPGRADCNLDPTDGCEASLMSVESCGACGNICPDRFVCTVDGCVDGRCGIGSTMCGFGCVDLQSDPMSCGACGAVCVEPDGSPGVCVAGSCASECPVGLGECDGDLTTSCETPLVDGYRDDDGDGHGVLATLSSVCPDTPGFATSAGDCDDDDPRVFTGQTLFFTSPRPDGSYDYDCDGVEGPEYRETFMCAAGGSCILLRSGFEPPVPGCGEVGRFVTDCTGAACTPSVESRIQGCR